MTDAQALATAFGPTAAVIILALSGTVVYLFKALQTERQSHLEDLRGLLTSIGESTKEQALFFSKITDKLDVILDNDRRKGR